MKRVAYNTLCYVPATTSVLGKCLWFMIYYIMLIWEISMRTPKAIKNVNIKMDDEWSMHFLHKWQLCHLIIKYFLKTVDGSNAVSCLIHNYFNQPFTFETPGMIDLTYKSFYIKKNIFWIFIINSFGCFYSKSMPPAQVAQEGKSCHLYINTLARILNGIFARF